MSKRKKIVIISTSIGAFVMAACLAVTIFIVKSKDKPINEKDTSNVGGTTYSDDEIPSLGENVISTSENIDESSTDVLLETTSELSETDLNVKEITLTSGLTSDKISEVLTYYKLVAKNNASLKMKKKLTLLSMDVGKVTVDETKDFTSKAETFFTPIAKIALSLASETVELPGTPDKIQESDWVSAKAVNDGKYTTLEIHVKEQSDGLNGEEFSGTVGRSMRVLPGFGAAIERLNGVTADFSTSRVEIQYKNPTITLKVENATGKLVKGECEWHYITRPILYVFNATMKVAEVHSVHLEGSKGDIDYSIKY